jgi:hypothetical protein
MQTQTNRNCGRKHLSQNFRVLNSEKNTYNLCRHKLTAENKLRLLLLLVTKQLHNLELESELYLTLFIKVHVIRIYLATVGLI